MDFSAKNNVTTLELPPYPPDLAPSDFYLLPQLKSALKVQHFYDATVIIKNMMEELKRGFHKCLPGMFPPLYSRWQKRIVAQEGYFEGNVA
jgi:transposase